MIIESFQESYDANIGLMVGIVIREIIRKDLLQFHQQSEKTFPTFNSGRESLRQMIGIMKKEFNSNDIQRIIEGQVSEVLTDIADEYAEQLTRGFDND